MATTSEIARRYFAALSDHDLDAATACWSPGGIDRFVGGRQYVAPDGIRAYFAALFDAFPDFRFEVLDVTSSRSRAVVRWRVSATFAGPGSFEGFAPNHARVNLEGCDVLQIAAEQIVHNDAYLDTGDVARQLGVLPPLGSAAEARLTRLANLRTKAKMALHDVQIERIADGVWIARGGFPIKTMNVYLIEDEGGLTVFDAGISAMGDALRAACARLGGIRRVVLGHADADHRGAAPALGAPVFCHAAERAAAESPSAHRDYWQLDRLDAHGRLLLARLIPAWDGGPLTVAGTVAEGDRIADFEVLHLPGHAPGLIGLYREADRLALVSDCFYTLDPQTGRKGAARVPHPAFDQDVEQARASIRKLAEREPAIAWAGHADPVAGDVRAQLEQAAAAPAG
jgi:hydroxyacylglutathione hydrolase